MKHRILRGALLTTALIGLSACEHTAQYTSGQDYLSGYSQTADARLSASSLPGGATEFDRELRSIAAVEPNLKFPARIGLARIERGHLTSVPEDEQLAWIDLKEELGADYGDFVPVSPMIASMVRPAPQRDKKGRRVYTVPMDVVSTIRRASARQHLDHVLIYEVNAVNSKKKTALSLTDLSVLGLWVMPSRKIKVEATASAMLIDVRNGYPYGQATAYADKQGVTTAMGSGDKRRAKTDAAKTAAVEALTDDVQNLMEELYVTSLKARVASIEYR